MHLLRALILFSALTLSSACSHSPLSDSASIETIVIMGTNDIHGAITQQPLKTREADGGAPVTYHTGGAATLASYVKILRSQYGNSFLWLDGGDEFQGSIESNSAQGEPVVDVLNSLGMNGAAVGNHEFDYGPSQRPDADPNDVLGALKDRMKQARYPYMASNIADKASGDAPAHQLPDAISRKVYSVGRLKVGVLGLTTLETPRSTNPTFVKDLVFQDLKETTLREAERLRSDGADLVVITAHAGLFCEKGRVTSSLMLRKPTDPQGDCDSSDEMVHLLKSLPAGTVDAVVAGHTHQVIHHWVAGVPVIQGGAYNRYFNLLYLNYDMKQKRLVTDLTRIEGPVPICPKVFKNQNDCNGNRPAPKGGRGPLVPYQFHGETITEDAATARLLKPSIERSEKVKAELLATAKRPIEHTRFTESALGDIVADSMREATGAQIAFTNSGGIRSNWEPGPITYGDVFRALPFDNHVVVLEVTGQELKRILRVAESGARGFFSVSGVKLRLLEPEADAPSDDLNHDGKIESWEINRLRDVQLDNGEPIQDNQRYKLATLDFLVAGGDSMGWVFSTIPADRISPPQALLRDAVSKSLKRLAQTGPINSIERPVVNPAQPRMVFEKPAKKGKGKGKARRRKRVVH